LYAGGDGVATCYWNREDLTSEKFVDNPFIPGDRLYRTGDLCRYRRDGLIEFLGRKDGQVKWRGYRIELGEIESVIASHPEIKESVLLIRTDIGRDKLLVAYVVAKSEQEISTAEMRRFLSGKLPDYMIPSIFVSMKELPLNPNGKVDRAALPSPSLDTSFSDDEIVEPRNAQERAISEMWREILGRDRVGVFDNFFDLGGHSLLATQIISRVRKQFQVDMTLRKLFENPTIAGISEAISELQGQKVVAGTESRDEIISKATTQGDSSTGDGVENISDEELDSMLKDLMGRKDGIS
jgi:acyl carrier protein